MSSQSSNPARLFYENRLLLFALAIMLVFHGGLLPFSAGKTYDAYIHMFFGDSYARSWFDPWEPRWYTGFSTTSYPPGTHMAIALLSGMFGLISAYVIVMLIGLATLTLGIYRFALLFVEQRAAGYATIFAVISTSVVETVHIFGQLPTIFSLGLFLNGLPHVYRWLVSGSKRELLAAVIMGAATTGAHHVTTIFGTLLFIGPVGLYAWVAYIGFSEDWQNPSNKWWQTAIASMKPLFRGLVLGVLLLVAIITTVFAYWYWSATDPITQVSIPHGSRESFLERKDLGLVFFAIPWGAQIFVLPYVFYKIFTSRMWPLGVTVFLCFVLGTGGTTPIPKMLLGPAFDILTLDRFTFWATILILPFTGLLLESLLHGQLGRVLIDFFGPRFYICGVLSFAVTILAGAIFTATLSTFRPMQPERIDPAPIVKFMNEDQHDRWRYLTLGFGDQFAYISAQTNAQSVDGNYHSARRLPELVSYAVERLENSKYLGVGGLGSLQQFLVNSDRYHLKFVFSNDPFYDPLLHFTGWNRLLRLPNGIMIWEKPDVAPLPSIQPRRSFPLSHMLMWGLLPPLAIASGYLCILITVLRRGMGENDGQKKVLTKSRKLSKTARRLAGLVIVALVLSLGGPATWSGFKVYQATLAPLSGDRLLEKYYSHLDFREFEKAYELLAPSPELDFETFMLNMRWVGGMVASYAKLTGFEAVKLRGADTSSDWQVNARFLTPFEEMAVERRHSLKRIDGHWRLVFEPFTGPKPAQRLHNVANVSWNRSGRRTPIKDDAHRDILDRPLIGITDARLIRQNDRYRLIGIIRNNDVDPASVKVTGYMHDASGNELISQQSGLNISHRLLAGQTGWFSVDFEGVLSLQDAEGKDAFDPKLFIPPELAAEPATARLSAQAVVYEENHYQGIATTILNATGEWVEAMLTNLGTKRVEVPQLQLAFFDEAGRIATVESAFPNADLKPGQSIRLRIRIPQKEVIELIHDLADVEVMTNKRVGSELHLRASPDFLPGFFPLARASGFSGVSINVQTMNFRPLF